MEFGILFALLDFLLLILFFAILFLLPHFLQILPSFREIGHAVFKGVFKQGLLIEFFPVFKRIFNDFKLFGNEFVGGSRALRLFRFRRLHLIQKFFLDTPGQVGKIFLEILGGLKSGNLSLTDPFQSRYLLTNLVQLLLRFFKLLLELVPLLDDLFEARMLVKAGVVRFVFLLGRFLFTLFWRSFSGFTAGLRCSFFFRWRGRRSFLLLTFLWHFVRESCRWWNVVKQTHSRSLLVGESKI